MKLFSSLIVTTIILVFYPLESQCCSCQPTHPEIQFCRADYAIKVLIVAKSMVQIDDSGNVISSATEENKNKPPPPLLSGSAPLPVDSIPLLHPIERTERDTPNLMKPDVDTSDDRSDIQVHITTSSKNKAINKAKKNKDEKRKRRRRRRHNKGKTNSQRGKRQAVFAGDFAPGQHIPSANLRLPSRAAPVSEYPSYTQYKVKVLKVFKGEQTELENTFVYTPPSGALCNMFLDIGESYLIMGESRDGKLHVGLCDFQLLMKQLNETEQRHLTNVMNHVYGKQCGECETNVCYNRDNCEHEERPYRCIWENLYTLLDYRAYQFVCVKKKQANPPTCEWHNSLDPKSHPRDLD